VSHVVSVTSRGDTHVWTCECGESGGGYASKAGAEAGGWLHRVLQRFVSRPKARVDFESWGGE